MTENRNPQFMVVMAPDTKWGEAIPCYTFLELTNWRAWLEAVGVPYRLLGPYRRYGGELL